MWNRAIGFRARAWNQDSGDYYLPVFLLPVFHSPVHLDLDLGVIDIEEGATSC